MLSIDCDLTAAHQQLSQMGDAAASVLREATFKGAQLVYQAAQAHAPKGLRHIHSFYSRSLTSGGERVVIQRGKRAGQTVSRYFYHTGDLRQSIYIKYLDEHRKAGEYEVYQISWRKQSSALGYVPYAHMVEYGTPKIPARPFVRPAFDATRAQAEQLIIDTIMQAIQSS